MSFKLRKFSIIGDPHPADSRPVVQLTYADHENFDEATQFVRIRLKLDKPLDWDIMDMERDHLRKVQELLESHIRSVPRTRHVT